jgi:gamma-glutamyl-gamma-aminobutyrate hydrolase PuuD
VINLHFGGTIAPVPSDRKLVHKDVARFARTGERAEHLATVLPGGSLMAAVFGEGTVKINSSHTMRCMKTAPGFRVTAQAEGDGVTEAIEHERLPIFGFQFHPEIYWTKDARFLELLRRALRGNKRKLD